MSVQCIAEILRTIKSSGFPVDAARMEFNTLILLICGAIGLWSIAGSFGALAQRLERQITLHQLKVDVRKVQRQRRAPSLMLSPHFDIATATDDWDYVADDSDQDIPAPVPLRAQRAA